MTTLTRVVNDANAREALYGAELLSSSVFISPKIDSTEISRFVLLKSKLVNFLVSPNLPANADQFFLLGLTLPESAQEAIRRTTKFSVYRLNATAARRTPTS